MITCCGQVSSLRNSSQADSVLAEAALLRAGTDTTGTAHATPPRSADDSPVSVFIREQLVKEGFSIAIPADN
jgi:hypothetical protein